MVRIGKTARTMYKRELNRNGRYRPSPAEQFWTVLIILTLFAVLGIISVHSFNITDLNLSQISLTTVLLPIILYITLKVSLEITWTLYGVYVIISAYLIADSFKGSPEYDRIRKIIFVTFVAFECGVLIFYVFHRVVFPRIVLILSRNDPVLFWNIKSIQKESAMQLNIGTDSSTDTSKCVKIIQNQEEETHQFESNKLKLLSGSYFGSGNFSYTGSLNGNNEPHGFGIWRAEWSSGYP
jgi:hypothetical protein